MRRFHERKCWGIALLFLLVHSIAVSAQGPARRSAAADSKPPSRSEYVGDGSCRSCHQSEASTYEATAHHLTSQPPDAHSIAGSFSADSNILKSSNPSLYFRMTADQDGFHQTAVDEVSLTKKIELTQRFDIVVGAARKAQTYLYWKGDDLFELPVSWWAETGQWINSPGYEDGSLRFDRPIVPRCLECHGTYFESLAPPSNRFRKDSLVLGIACETCHGPGRAHVALYSAATPPGPGVSKAIVNPASLPRSRNIDTCALCHAGLGKSLAPALSFVPGDTLSKYLQIPEADSDASVDVHGNQLQLLKRSACFKSSNMTCTTCHNVHKEQRDAAAFSSICLDCHKAKQCGEYPKLGEQITRDCVSCHMPLRKSEALVSDTNQQTLKLIVREHRIAIYPETRR